MKKIFVLVEHRRGKIMDITFELLTKGRELAKKLDSELVALVLGHNIKEFIDRIKKEAHRVSFVDSELLKEPNAEAYQIVLSNILKKEKFLLTLVGHTALGMDLASSLAASLEIPIATDCIELDVENDELFAIRQPYNGKLNARVSFLPGEGQGFIITVRQGSFPQEEGSLSGKLVALPSPLEKEPDYRRFIEYIEAVMGEVDITKADVIVAIGRGIREKENMPLVEELANSLGGVLACSRPIVDNGWLPKDRQVGSSGKTVKPKLYIAIGISGSFQHIAGIKGSDTVVAVNKDPNAPIFNEADYGIVDDLFKVVPVLKEKIKELK